MPIDHAALDRVFNPKTVAIIGDKKASGYMWLNANRNFKGNLYSVQIDPNEIPGIEEMGIKNLTSLADVPEPIDYAIVAVPRVVAPRIVAECIRNKVGDRGPGSVVHHGPGGGHGPHRPQLHGALQPFPGALVLHQPGSL